MPEWFNKTFLQRDTMWTVIWSICGSLRSVLAFKEKVVVAEKSLRILTENSNVCEKGAKVRHYTVLEFRSQWLSPVGCIHLVTQGVAQGHYIFISRLWGGRNFFPALTTKQTPISFIQNTKERKIRFHAQLTSSSCLHWFEGLQYAEIDDFSFCLRNEEVSPPFTVFGRKLF